MCHFCPICSHLQVQNRGSSNITVTVDCPVNFAFTELKSIAMGITNPKPGFPPSKLPSQTRRSCTQKAQLQQVMQWKRNFSPPDPVGKETVMNVSRENATLTERYWGVRLPMFRFPIFHRLCFIAIIFFWSFSFCVSANFTTRGDEQPWAQFAK